MRGCLPRAQPEGCRQRGDRLTHVPRGRLATRESSSDALGHLVVEIAEDGVAKIGREDDAERPPGRTPQPADHRVCLRSPCHMRASCCRASSSAATPVGVMR